jgi:hypothetical protein
LFPVRRKKKMIRLVRRSVLQHSLIATLCAVLLLAPSTTALAQQPGGGLTIPIVGTAPGGSFAGAFLLQRFAVVNGAVSAVGILTGTLTTATGTTSVVRSLSLPIGNLRATCDILHLELGPLDLDLLGLVVHLDRIVLDIDAQSGPGNLLGNLLCAVAGLLDNPSGLADVLNRILRILG